MCIYVLKPPSLHVDIELLYIQHTTNRIKKCNAICNASSLVAINFYTWKLITTNTYTYFKLIIYIFKKKFPSNFAALATAYWEALGISETLDWNGLIKLPHDYRSTIFDSPFNKPILDKINLV